MGCGGIGDVGNVAGSNSVAVPHHGKMSRRGLDGVGFKTMVNVTFKGSSEAADTDFRVADIAINQIVNLLNWTVSKSRPILPTQADLLCTSVFTLVHNLSDLGIFKDYATHDELGVQSL